MRSMGTRRAALIAGVATVAAAALTGCSAGQLAETANKEASVYGLNTQNADGSVLLRGLAVTYGTVQGYPAGGNAPLELNLYNQTDQPIRVTITSQPPAGDTEGVVSARSVGLTGGASASASASASTTASTVPAEAEPTGSRPAAQKGGGPSDPTPGTQAGQGSAGPSAPATPAPASTPTVAAPRPAQITVAPLGSAVFRPGDAESLQVIGLTGTLRAGNSVNLVFSFSNGVQPLTVQAPVGVPLSPIPRGSAENEGVGSDEGH